MTRGTKLASRNAAIRKTSQVAWDDLLSQLPQATQARFERVLRRSLKRRLDAVGRLDTSVAPDTVRSQAVADWRKRYMKGEPKGARKRMNYARLRNEPTYQVIERKLSSHYWKAQSLPTADEVDALTFAEACEAYRATCPKSGATPLDELMRSTLQRAYAEYNPERPVREKIAKRLCAIARTQQLGKHAGPHAPSFGLDDLTTEAEVVRRVRERRIVEYLLRAEYKKKPPYLVARDLIVTRVAAHPQLVALQNLMCALMGSYDMVAPALERRAKPDARSIEKYLLGHKMASRVAHELLRNPHYGPQFRRNVELRLRVRENVPQTPMEAYPLARTLARRIVLHVGPTNSGKTHSALQALAAASSGAYLGPLRLLAYEKFEELNRMGCVCSLLTGEEAVDVAGAHHVSSTVEMANFAMPIDVAVIDEAQMIADKSRGHHWTEALLGIPAREVHVCCAPHAEQVLSELVALCDDELEVVRHERLVPLRSSKGAFRLPADVQPGDALIVFSRRSVHMVAAQVAAYGMKPSVIYGALPHDVRHEEARRFDEGETDVVVATDAIGMGMNLPIRRIVFVEQDKFDGVSQRILRPEEVQQIAGRAGRFGRYDEGLYQSTKLRKEIVRRYNERVPDIDTVPVGIPADIALVRDATLTDCIRQWMALEQPRPFKRIGVERDLALIRSVEAKLEEARRTDTESKLLVLALATMAFDERDKELYRLWRRMVDAELAGEELDVEVPPAPSSDARLIDLERQYRYCDLLYTYARTFAHPARLESLSKRRGQISHAIMDILASTTA